MKTKRHSKILELVNSRVITTQEDMLDLLKEYGFNVTQATVSRDIKELKLIKTLDANGNYKYAVKSEHTADISSKFSSLFREGVVNINYSGNIVVIRCYQGLAQAACAALDSVEWNGVVGSLAGDDTIFVVMSSEENASEFVHELKKYTTKR